MGSSRASRRSTPSPGWLRPLKDRIKRREARVAVVGLGYVGLPVLLGARRAGYPVIGFEADPDKVQALKAAPPTSATSPTTS